MLLGMAGLTESVRRAKTGETGARGLVHMQAASRGLADYLSDASSGTGRMCGSQNTFDIDDICVRLCKLLER
jgi:hypothetical protein